MSEPQLERSVLEAKERDELFAIAEALGARPTTRARKGDLVNAILRATGVEVGSEPEPPRRPRTRRTPSRPAAGSARAPTGEPSDQAEEVRPAPAAQGSGTPLSGAPGSGGQGSGAPGSGRAEPLGASAPEQWPNGAGERSEAAVAGRLPFEANEPAAAASPPSAEPGPVSSAPASSGPAPSGPVSSGPVASGPGSSGPVEAASPEPSSAGSGSPGPGSVEPGGGAGPVAGGSASGTSPTFPAVNGGGSPTPSRPGALRPSRPPRTGYIASPDGGTAGSVPPVARGRAGAQPQRRGSDQSDARPAAPSARTPALSPGNAAPPTASSATSVPATSAGSAPSVTVPAGDGHPTGGQSAPEGAAPAGDGTEQRPRAEGESGNRRNRRRRGRDRGERNVERDLPNQNTEAPYSGEPLPVSGYLDLREEGYGFLRTEGYVSSQADVYVSISQVRRFSLRKGDWLEGASRPAAATEKYPALLRIDTVAGQSPDDARNRPVFDDLTAVTPNERIALARDDDPAAADVRLIDLFAPLARGQRALVVGGPRTGKTGILVDVVASLETAHPELQLLVLVVDERPEEVTELRRAIRSDIIATTFDRPPEEHIQVAELVVERAKRMVEGGADVVIVADGLTRLARAYNLVPSGSSRVLPGGVDAGAVQRTLALFAAGRNIEGGGSLTLLATATVDTGSRLDEMVFEELTAVANMQVRLDRQLARRDVRPALDLGGSWCRNEDRLLDGGTLERVRTLRLRIEGDPGPAFEDVLERLGATKSNQEFLLEAAPEAPSRV